MSSHKNLALHLFRTIPLLLLMVVVCPTLAYAEETEEEVHLFNFLGDANSPYKYDDDQTACSFGQDASGNPVIEKVCGTHGYDKKAQKLFMEFSNDLVLLMANPLTSDAKTLGEAGTSFDFQLSFSGIIGKTQEAWQRAFLKPDPPDTFLVGHFQIRKGLPLGFELGARASYLFGRSIFGIGFDIKLAIIEGQKYLPDWSIMISPSTIVGIKDYRTGSLGVGALFSKSFGIAGTVTLTPRVAYQAHMAVAGSTPLNARPQSRRSPGSHTNGAKVSLYQPQFNYSFEATTLAHRLNFGVAVDFWLLRFTIDETLAFQQNLKIKAFDLDQDYHKSLINQTTLSLGMKF